MTAYYNDLKLFFQKAGAFPGNDGRAARRAGHLGLHGAARDERQRRDGAGEGRRDRHCRSWRGCRATCPDSPGRSCGCATRTRRTSCSAYHVSVWGTEHRHRAIEPAGRARSTRSARGRRAFYNSLGANFDIAFAEFSDRDAGFKQYVVRRQRPTPGGTPRTSAATSAFSAGSPPRRSKRIVMWQIPLGNTKMRAQNNTTGPLPGQPRRSGCSTTRRARTSRPIVDAGVVAFLFGGGAGGTTCACDATGRRRHEPGADQRQHARVRARARRHGAGRRSCAAARRRWSRRMRPTTTAASSDGRRGSTTRLARAPSDASFRRRHRRTCVLAP